MVIGPAWLGALLKASGASAALSPDIQALLGSGQWQRTTASRAAFICFDLAERRPTWSARGAGGRAGRPAELPVHRGYGKLGVRAIWCRARAANIDASLGLLWHATAPIKRGYPEQAATPPPPDNGAVLCAMSQNDTQNIRTTHVRHRQGGGGRACLRT